MAKKKLLKNKKGFVYPQPPTNKAKQLMKLFMSKLTGAAGVETNTIRTILFGVDENAARIVYDSYQDRIERHKAERLNEEMLSLVKTLRREKDEKAKTELAKKIESREAEFYESYTKELNFTQEIWDRHANFMNDLVSIERELFRDISTLRSQRFPDEPINKIMRDAYTFAEEMKKGAKKELDLAQALKTSTFSVSKWDPRDSDAIDRVDRKLGYRIDSIQKSLKQEQENMKEATQKTDVQKMFKAVENSIGLLRQEWLEVHAIGMNIGVLLARLLELCTEHLKIISLYAQTAPQKRSLAENMAGKLREANEKTLDFIRSKAQQVELREESL